MGGWLVGGGLLLLLLLILLPLLLLLLVLLLLSSSSWQGLLFRNDEGRRPTESIQSCGVLGFELREFEGLQFTGSEVGSAVSQSFGGTGRREEEF